MATIKPRVARTSPAALETHLGFWLRLVSNGVSARFRKAVEAYEVSVSEWVALRALFDDELTGHAALTDRLGLSKGAVSKLVARLQDKGLLERGADSADPRAQRLRLSPAGRALVPRLAALADENDAHFFAHLGPARCQALQTLLQALAQHHGLQQPPLE
jgi:DNA-binding MarR family transcriptional regulator